ncbi:1,3-beta-glucanosyltransferase KNAG_0B05690 [Huiozyma naganishii CBS 8797]|uniref:1,3-beta-glucanosyltransferase n=1 Tax=Huiozyma naganishii (strain ATCC MYA-139 / BCRC 22969 / CBS 8797 / KCTC 17520 / NBRC 10181 / NCYC 3082 / Yp74L-3) TaxID=1071383 RepID=J7S590_HUIN7|nr:hypothetical protein KNAG_0B05690 [Kazachstania naganishii CBS 8797]CCK69001.1 hypothetical protein KNAG_0B05690 [Kazachstania naganishii CBS 8797]
MMPVNLWFSTYAQLLFINLIFAEKVQFDFPTIEIYGNKFFNSRTSNQFFMKGIAYQPRRDDHEMEVNQRNDVFETKYIDPLAEPSICLRDLPYLNKLGVNTIRVYSIDPTKSHDVCMEALKKENIYVLIDLSEPDVSIIRDNPVWSVEIWKRYKDVVDSMEQYPNVLGFFAGNEVTNDNTNTDASPFVKAAIRDLKKYMEEQKYRAIPVGYSTNDDVDTRMSLAQYYVCGDVTADFYGINMYEWCGYSSFGTSGYKERTEEFENYPVPVFFSEFGCNLVRPRPFTEVGALFGPKMSKVWSGGLVYMFFEEENGYGVVSIDEQTGEVVELPDFENLRREYSKVKVSGIKKEEFDGTFGRTIAHKNINCPAKTSNWKANSQLPHTPNDAQCQCLDVVLPCLVEAFDDDEKYKTYFDYVCDKVDCSDITANGEKGDYGEFSECSATQKLALQISKLYMKEGTGTKICPLDDPNVYFNDGVNQKKEKQCGTIYDKVKNKSLLGKKAPLKTKTGKKLHSLEGSVKNNMAVSDISSCKSYIIYIVVLLATSLI